MSHCSTSWPACSSAAASLDDTKSWRLTTSPVTAITNARYSATRLVPDRRRHTTPSTNAATHPARRASKLRHVKQCGTPPARSLARVRRCFGPRRARPPRHGTHENASTGRDETGRGQTKASPVCGPGVPRSANGDEGLCVIHGFVRMLDVRYRRQLKHGRMLTFTQPRE